jgi:hypothetical protein
MLPRYEKALELTRAMLAAALKSDWDCLVPLEKERSALIDELRELDVDAGRDAAVRDRKRQVILDIMQCDEQIQILTQDWMRELREVLSSISAEQKLSRTYGS